MDTDTTEEVKTVKIEDTSRMGATVRFSAKEAYRVSPAGLRMIVALPAKERKEIMVAADAKRVEVGHPTVADATTGKVWDHHIMLALGVAPTPEAQAEFRKELGLPRPSVA